MPQALRYCLLALWLFLFPVAALADFSQSDWRYYKEVSFASPSLFGYQEFIVDSQLYNRAHDDLRDIRIVDKDKDEIPYQILIKRRKVSLVPYSPKMFNLSVMPGSCTVFHLDMGGQELFHNLLTISTTSKNFRRRAEISGSQDQKEWYRLKERGYIFDFTEEYHAQHTTVDYPEANYRYLRVTIWDEKEKPLQITGARLYREQVEEAEENQIPIAKFERKENPERRATEFYIDLGGRGQPCHRLSLNISSRNYHRQVEVAGSNERERWYSLGSSYLYHFETENYRSKQTTITFNESQYQYLKISILNYDDEPLNVENLNLRGTPRKAIFNRKSKGPYYVYYGRERTPAPQYDLAKLLPHLELKSLPIATLGLEEINEKFVERVAKRPWTEENPWLFWSIITIVVLSLATLILRSLRQIK